MIVTSTPHFQGYISDLVIYKKYTPPVVLISGISSVIATPVFAAESN